MEKSDSKLPDFDLLNDIFVEAAYLRVVKAKDGTSKIVLKEEQCKDSYITIRNVSDSNIIVISLDKIKPKNCIFKTDNHHPCRMADFVIINTDSRCKRIIYVEMKRTTDKENIIKDQLQGADCYFRYCIDVVRKFYDNNKFLDGYEPRFYSITNTSNRKQRTKKEYENSRQNRKYKGIFHLIKLKGNEFEFSNFRQ